MKLIKFLPLALAIFGLTSCSENDEPGGGTEPQSGTYALSGKVEKGPFVRGSKLSVQPLNASLNQIGSVYTGEITDDAGNFDLGKVELASQLVRIEADGYFYNEVRGWLSDGQLHLVAYADLSDKSTVNVNILTHLKAPRVKKLMEGGKNFAEANSQAQKELLTQFGLQRLSSSAESWSVTSGSDEAAALIAISSIVLYNRNEAEITEFLSSLSQDLANLGEFTEGNKYKIFEAQKSLQSSLESVAGNVVDRYKDLGKSVSVKDLKFFFDWDCDGIAGNEFNENPQVTLSQTEVSFPKEGGEVSINVTSNVKLSLSTMQNPYQQGADSEGNLDLTPEDGITEDTFYSGFFTDYGSFNCETSYANGVLRIKSSKACSRSTQKQTIRLYDALGVERAAVEVSIAGDPSIVNTLGNEGQAVVSQVAQQLATGLSWSYYVERGYTGMYEFYGVKCPMLPSDSYNQRAYNAMARAMAATCQFSAQLKSYYPDATTCFEIVKAILYTDIADKWGRYPILDDFFDGNYYGTMPPQATTEELLNHALSLLDAAYQVTPDGKVLGYNFNAQTFFDMNRDVIIAAQATALMQLGKYNDAAIKLEQIVGKGRYNLNSKNEYDQSNDAIILGLSVPDEVVSGHYLPVYSYTEMVLNLAECRAKTGNSAGASSLINEVATAKKISISGDAIADIALLRKQLFTPHYFAFQKRNNLGGYEAYQYLWPIPGQEITINPTWTQNPGY